MSFNVDWFLLFHSISNTADELIFENGFAPDASTVICHIRTGCGDVCWCRVWWTNPLGAEMAFINFNVPDKGLGFLNGHINYPVTKQSENPLNGIAVDRAQIGRRCGRDVLAKTLQNPSEFDLRNV